MGNASNAKGKCVFFERINGTVPSHGTQSGHPPPMKKGYCLLFSDVVSTYPSKASVSGGSKVKPVPPTLYPSWPASSEYVTAVGSTRFIDQSSDKPEMATDQFGSGGGFWNMAPVFKDQEQAVKTFLDTCKAPTCLLPPSGSFPAGGRATPDVSALGEGFQVIVNGRVNSVGGTSASAPTFAAIVSLLNEARLQKGKPAMGWLNPWLYQNPQAFTDIIAGDNAYGRGPFRTRYGFNCTAGWDPVSGLGTPIFPKMLQAAMKAVSSEAVFV
jgi:tripeptidyl-peptidase-1